MGWLFVLKTDEAWKLFQCKSLFFLNLLKNLKEEITKCLIVPKRSKSF